MIAFILFMKKNPITSTVNFEKDGLQHGYLKLPHSHDDSAWGSIVIPITVAKNGMTFLEDAISSFKNQKFILV